MRAIQGLKERIHIACCALVLHTNVSGFFLGIVASRTSISKGSSEYGGDLLDEVMPQDACRVFEDTDVHGDVGGLVLDCRSRITLLYGEEFA